MLMLILTRGKIEILECFCDSGSVIGIKLIRQRLATLGRSKEPEPKTVIKTIAESDL